MIKRRQLVVIWSQGLNISVDWSNCMIILQVTQWRQQCCSITLVGRAFRSKQAERILLVFFPFQNILVPCVCVCVCVPPCSLSPNNTAKFIRGNSHLRAHFFAIIDSTMPTDLLTSTNRIP